MFRLSLATVLMLTVATPVLAQDAGSVAGRPALSTKSTQDLVSQREKWGTAPAAKPAAKAAAPAAAPAAKAAAPAAAAATTAALAVLPTDITKNLIAEREKWGKGPAGWETKKVVAPPAAGAGKAKAKAAPAKPAKSAKSTKKKKNDG